MAHKVTGEFAQQLAILSGLFVTVTIIGDTNNNSPEVKLNVRFKM